MQGFDALGWFGKISYGWSLLVVLQTALAASVCPRGRFFFF